MKTKYREQGKGKRKKNFEAFPSFLLPLKELNMKKQSDNEEQRLLNNSSLDELIKMKMEEEIMAEFEKSQQKPVIKVITDISKVPADLVFSKKAVYKVFNRVNKTQTFINGLQAEALLGLQTSMRTKIKAGKTDTFSTDTAYVKFEKILY